MRCGVDRYLHIFSFYQNVNVNAAKKVLNYNFVAETLK